MSGHADDARQQRRARLRAGLMAAAGAVVLLAAICAGSPAGASPTPGRAAAAGGYLYWSNTIGSITKPGDGVIVRARQDGSDVNQKFITGASLPGMILVYRGYWANDFSIGRASLDGTGVNQNFVADPKGGPAGLAVTSCYLYWTNEYHNTIGRARLDGTQVDQTFITGASFPDAIAAGSRYLYWANAALGANPNRRAIGRALLNGTDVNQRFVARKDFANLHGVAVGPGR